MSEQRPSKELVTLICVDCEKLFDGHPGDDVCSVCWDAFNGMTLDELVGASQPPSEDRSVR